MGDRIVEKVARGMAARKMGIADGGVNLPDHLWRQCTQEAYAVLEASHHEELVKALKAEFANCGSCGGKGICYTMGDETEIGQPPGSSGRDCEECAQTRAVLAKVEASHV